MTSYVTSYYYVMPETPFLVSFVIKNPNLQTLTATDTSGDETLSGLITIGETSEQFNYYGYWQEGWIGQSTSPSHRFVYFTQTPKEYGSAVDYSRDPMPVCFLRGTGIATPEGLRPVEDLRIGELVLTTTGQPCPIRWIGRQEMVAFFADRATSYPIRIQAGALAEQLPARDLSLSPSHALAIDGLLVQAGALVNGSSICRPADPGERFTYFHIELEDHALVLAEGVAAETFVDNVTRRRFDNYQDHVALYGEVLAPTGELAAPRVKSPRQLPAGIRARLADRAAALLPRRDAA
ncbi:Hint domain-containing protein [Roseomonas sp. 18066]|uniref:Hint domain-containing protein n=1 Tax=Roseomonas sp. 18066 TaxID=2681412 RepID=UPI00135AEDB1|nr:Hint domain-containing protein [Roseomonas sp. 18066]